MRLVVEDDRVAVIDDDAVEALRRQERNNQALDEDWL
jgi:hypothetical protein